MKVKLFDGFNNVVLRTGDDSIDIGRLIVVWESSGWGGGDVVMLANSLDVGDASKDIWMFWATLLEFGEEGENVWVGSASSLEVCDEGDLCWMVRTTLYNFFILPDVEHYSNYYYWYMITRKMHYYFDSSYTFFDFDFINFCNVMLVLCVYFRYLSVKGLRASKWWNSAKKGKNW